MSNLNRAGSARESDNEQPKSQGSHLEGERIGVETKGPIEVRSNNFQRTTPLSEVVPKSTPPPSEPSDKSHAGRTWGGLFTLTPAQAKATLAEAKRIAKEHSSDDDSHIQRKTRTDLLKVQQPKQREDVESGIVKRSKRPTLGVGRAPKIDTSQLPTPKAPPQEIPDEVLSIRSSEIDAALNKALDITHEEIVVPDNLDPVPEGGLFDVLPTEEPSEPPKIEIVDDKLDPEDVPAPPDIFYQDMFDRRASLPPAPVDLNNDEAIVSTPPPLPNPQESDIITIGFSDPEFTFTENDTPIRRKIPSKTWWSLYGKRLGVAVFSGILLGGAGLYGISKSPEAQAIIDKYYPFQTETTTTAPTITEDTIKDASPSTSISTFDPQIDNKKK